MDVSTSESIQSTATRKRTPRRLESVAGSWPIWVKVAASIVLISGPVAQLIDRALYDMSNSYVSLFRAYSANPGAVNIGAVAGMLAPALLIGAVIIWYRLARVRSKVAATISLVSGVLAFTCLAVMSGYSFSAMGLSEAHLGTPAVADALSAYAGPPAMFLFATFQITSTLSILAAAWGLWRSHAVSRASVILLALFIVIDMLEILPIEPHFIGLAAMVLMCISFFTAAPFRDGSAAASIKK
ncbi:MAG: hypothetical protein KDB18_06130 [Salinibacterium sp.]|nr:hypothetical protein [Salinibacterium sp.]